MTERHEEYMKRKMREEQHSKIYESPDKGETIYERDFGSINRSKIKGYVADFDNIGVEYTLDGNIEIKLHEVKLPKIISYKYNEGNLIEEFKAYVDATYSQHYSRDKFQATEFIMDGGHGTGFCIGNVLKYAQRYGKKGTRDDARKDIMKVLHYALLQLYVHDIENEQ